MTESENHEHENLPKTGMSIDNGFGLAQLSPQAIADGAAVPLVGMLTPVDPVDENSTGFS